MGIFYLYGVGIGGIKLSVSGFGTDQFDQTDDKEKAQMVNFFNRFYFFINRGTLATSCHSSCLCTRQSGSKLGLWVKFSCNVSCIFGVSVGD